MKYVTSVERIGIKKGMEKGMEKGIQKGILQGKVTLFKDLLRHRFPELPAWAETMLSEAGQEDLERWGRRLLDARSLEDVFAVT